MLCSDKQVFTRLQMIGLCLSRGSTIKLVDELGEGFDQDVLKWKADAESSMDVIVSIKTKLINNVLPFSIFIVLG